MRLVLLACAGVAVLSLGAGVTRGAPLHAAVAEVTSTSPQAGPPLTPALCPTGMLPDGDACVRAPGDDDDGPEAQQAEANAHHDKRGNWIVYDQIPRRPDRPADYDAYRYPVPCDHGCVVSGYDLDRPDEAQRRGRKLSHVGHGAVDIPQKKGTPISMVALEHEQGPAQVVYVGPLFGTTVMTRHTLREGGQLHEYLMLFGHLDAPAPGLAPGSALAPGELVGFVGDTGSPELVHLHLETRRIRDGVDVTRLGPGAMIANESSVVCDPRNVLPLR
jgi:murein DD-endopeptidase MepM/ murein hydrolase activator NlpD